MLKTVILVCVCFTITTQNENPLLKIDQGILKGTFRKSLTGKEYRSFTGIPYAQPPVGELRFKMPEPAHPWEGILDATKNHGACPQMNVFIGDYNVTGDEDCLYLNVYTPRIQSSDNQDLLPVMFFIHGGGLTSGDATTYTPDILIDYDVILVTINYRLGALGFLVTLKDGVISGNNGLKDQNLALKWVKNNIVHFGGNPDNIVVFGHSAGALSAHYHMLSPLSKDLISGVIIQSSSALSPWGLRSITTMLKNAEKLANLLDCPSMPNEALIDCLRKIPANDIVKQDIHFLEWSHFPIAPFQLIIETESNQAFLAEEPADIIKKDMAAKVPMMIGITSEDGAMFSADIYKNKLEEDLDLRFNVVAPYLLAYEKSSNKIEISEKVRSFYFGNNRIDDNSKNNVTKMATDAWLYTPVHNSVRLHSQYIRHNVYYYVFGYRGTQSYSLIFSDANDKYNYGVCHGDELFYLFNLKFPPNTEFTEDELKISNVLGSLWTNFAKTKNPTPSTNEIIPTIWSPVKIVFYSDELLYIFTTRAFGIYHNIDIEKKVVKSLVKLWTNFAKYGDPTPTKHEDLAKWEPVKDENFSFYYVNNSAHFQMSENPFLERFQFWKEIRDPITKCMF
ncbi:hypothetical protein RN001_008736 [Aquatica leii]|uniref:Carboxylic ester hydrolase n=1 Tax=Aquatica leii TaxID=1421715 RepID=A0AAN7SRG8_9COLE|nr:hypothetical protein RN001_008736 [Aquatica leii]